MEVSNGLPTLVSIVYKINFDRFSFYVIHHCFRSFTLTYLFSLNHARPTRKQKDENVRRFSARINNRRTSDTDFPILFGRFTDSKPRRTKRVNDDCNYEMRIPCRAFRGMSLHAFPPRLKRSHNTRISRISM